MTVSTINDGRCCYDVTSKLFCRHDNVKDPQVPVCDMRRAELIYVMTTRKVALSKLKPMLNFPSMARIMTLLLGYVRLCM